MSPWHNARLSEAAQKLRERALAQPIRVACRDCGKGYNAKSLAKGRAWFIEHNCVRRRK